MIETKQNQIVNNSGAYIDDDNNLQGTCNPLKMFFSKKGITDIGTGDARVTCPVSGIYANSGADLTLTGNLLSFATTLQDILAVDDTEASVNNYIGSSATEDTLLVFSGEPRVANDQFTINIQDGDAGNATLVSIKNKNTGTVTPVLTDEGGNTASTATLGVTTAGGIYTSFLGVDRSANLEANRNDGSKSGTVTEQTTAITGVVTGNLVFDTLPQINFNSDIYGMGYFIFPSGLPQNYKAMANWMAWNWAQGNYVFPDSWRNEA